MKYKRYLSAFVIGTAMMLASCTNDTQQELPPSADAYPLVIYASITGGASTRATRMTVEDKWSYTAFTNQDAMGFYSSGGNWMDNEGKGSFDNLQLQYDATRQQFTDLTTGVEFSPSHMSGSQIFMYFPYNADMNDKGLELRQSSVSPLRCIDLLSSNVINVQGVVDNKKVALYGTFDHAFSELIIMRGEGFDSPPQGYERITAVLSEPYTNIKVKVSVDETTWNCTPALVWNDANTLNLTQEDAYRWDAWKGGNYGITKEDTVGKPAWYIIVPTLGSEVGKKKTGARSKVEYIELYDNEGYLQRVSSLQLSGGNTKFVDAGWRYPMEITMKELVPTVNPFKIIPWNEDVNLTDERQRGINNEAEFALWVRAYNAYLKDPKDEQKINTLLKYGDSFVDAEQKRSWHFYVLSDLDFSKYNPLPDESGDSNGREEGDENDEGNNGEGGDNDNESSMPSSSSDYIIPELYDVLDGISTTLVSQKFINHTIKGLSQTFINKLGENGLIHNFDFISPKVKNDDSSAAGIIVNIMEESSVVNCNIDNGDMYHPNGPAGMVAGSMTNGVVKDCTLSGFLVAGSTQDKIIGTISGTATFEGNDADAVIANP